MNHLRVVDEASGSPREAVRLGVTHCDMCGEPAKPLDGEGCCRRCAHYMKGMEEAAVEFAEVTLIVAKSNGVSREDLYQLVDDVFDGRGIYGGQLG